MDERVGGQSKMITLISPPYFYQWLGGWGGWMKGLGGAEYDERLLRSPLLTSINGWWVGMSG